MASDTMVLTKNIVTIEEAGRMADMTIVVPLTLDGREIARATAWSMGEQLAWEADLSATYISYIENGTKKPSLESLVSICNVLGITVDDLLAGNQKHSSFDYQTDVAMIMKGTSATEKRLIYELMYALLNIIRKNEWELISPEEIDYIRKKF